MVFQRFRMGSFWWLIGKCTDKQIKPVLLMRKDMLDSGVDTGLGRIGSLRGLWHRFDFGLASVDMARQHLVRQPLFVAA
jgi:hypothetical protein